MSLLQFRSAEAPFGDARVAGEAARLLALLEAIGVWHPRAVVDNLGATVFSEALEALANRDVGVTAPFEWKSHAEEGPEEFARWIRTGP